jgi:hypothetical protein
MHNAMEATNLVEDILLPEAANNEIHNKNNIYLVQKWVITNDQSLVEQNIKQELPALAVGELYALGLGVNPPSYSN